MDKTEIERKLESEWQAARALMASLADDEMEEAGVVDNWSIKDLLGHMAFWAQKGADDLALAIAGRVAEIATPAGDVQVAEWNARETSACRGKSLEDVKREWIDSFAAAQTALTAASPDVLNIEHRGWTVGHRFVEDTYRHYREHAAQIRAWQQEMETTEA